LTPLGILHIEAFVTLCEAYMEIEPHFDLWNYFFDVQLRPGLDAEVAMRCSADMSVQSRLGVDSYFCHSMSNPLVRWQKEWFFLRNSADTPLLMFTSNRPIPQPNWGTVWINDTSTSYNPCVTSFSSCYKTG
jgi:hypothetical protein